MNEQEYCDLSDLQMCRTILTMLRSANCFDDPNKTRIASVMENIRLVISDLEPKVSESMYKDA